MRPPRRLPAVHTSTYLQPLMAEMARPCDGEHVKVAFPDVERVEVRDGDDVTSEAD